MAGRSVMELPLCNLGVVSAEPGRTAPALRAHSKQENRGEGEMRRGGLPETHLHRTDRSRTPDPQLRHPLGPGLHLTSVRPDLGLCAQSLQSCLTLGDPQDCSPPVSPVKLLVKVAKPSSKSSRPID